MTDNDPIRRGDVVKATAEYLWETQVDPMLLWYVEQAVLAIPAADPLADPRVQALVEVLKAVAQHEVSIFWGPDAEKNERASWRGVMRKVKAALAYVEGSKT